MRRNEFSVVLAVAVVAALGMATSASAALMLKLEAANYSPLTGTWTDTSGNNNHATQGTGASRPSVVANRTANGSSVVRFDGVNDFFNLTSSISPASPADGYTAFAYLRPNTGTSPRTIFSGALDSLQYRIVAPGRQETLEANVGAHSTGSNPVPEGETSAFSSINARVNSAGVTGGLRLNGSVDGNTVPNSFSNPITGVGRKFVAPEVWFAGDIAEIRIYDTQLTLPQVQAVEAELTAAYETPAGRVALPVILNPTFDTDANLFTSFPGYAGGSNPAEIPSWPGTGNRGINPGDGAGSPFRDNGNNASNVAFLQNVANIAQSISGWEAGKNYRIAFDYNARSGNDPDMTATIGSGTFTDASVPPVGGTNSYYAGNIVFTPTSVTETLEIEQTASPAQSLLVDNFRVFRNGPTIADNGFENPVQPDNDWKQANGVGGGDLSGSAWTITGAAGITRNISAFQDGGIPAPEGDQHALIQNSGSFVQTISGFEVGAEYSLSLLTMARQAANGGTAFDVLLDADLGTQIVLFDIAEVIFSSFTELESPAFVAEKDSYELSIVGSLEGGLSDRRTTFFDNVWFNQLTEAPTTVIPEPSTLLIWSLLAGLAMGLGWRRRTK